MKQILTFLLLFLSVLPLQAQQAQEVKRTTQTFCFPEFVEAKILQPFGRSVTARANIFYKDAGLYFLDGDTIKKAFVDRILGVQFGDSVTFRKVTEDRMGRVIARQGYNELVCVTVIDMAKLRSETEGGENLPFLEIEGRTTSSFFEIDGDRFAEKNYPLKNIYFFIVRGMPVPAKESQIKTRVKPELQRAFRDAVEDRWWSWNDAESLKKLLQYLP